MKNLTTTARPSTNVSYSHPPSNLYISGSINFTFVALTLIGNGLVCIAYKRYENLRTPSTSLLVSMATCDLLMITSTILSFTGDASSASVQSYSCSVSGSWSFLVITMIMLHLCAISVDRLLAVKYSLRYHALVTQGRIQLAIVTIWLLGLVEAVLMVIVVTLSDIIIQIKDKAYPCISYWSIMIRKTYINGDPVLRGFSISSFIILFIIPFLIILYCYGYIWRQSLRHSKDIKMQRLVLDSHKQRHHKEHLRSTKTFALVIGVFLVTFFPILIVSCLEIMFRIRVHRNVMAAFAYLCGTSATWSPFIYAWRDKRFKNAFKKISCIILKCNRTQLNY